MSNINIEDIPSGGLSVNRLIEPGNRVVKILDVTLKMNPFPKKNPEDQDSIEVALHVEGPDMGEEFNGFLIDKDDPSKGKYKGQIGTIKAGLWPFSTGVTKGGVKIDRDTEMLRFLKNICKEMNLMDWLRSENNKHPTALSFMEAFVRDKPFLNKWIRVCIAGKEYTNKKEYTNYNLFFPKYTVKHTVIELETVPEDKSRLLKFDPLVHLVKDVTTAKEVKSFGEEKQLPTKKLSSDFDL